MASREWPNRQHPYARIPALQNPTVRRRLGVFAIIVLVLGLSAGTGLLTGGYYSRLGLLAIYALLIALVGFFYISERLNLGVLLLLFTAGFVPLSLPTGTASRIPDSMVIAVALAAVWVIRMLVVDKRFHLAFSPTNAPVLLWVIVTVISLVWSMYFRDPQVVIWDSFPLVQVASAVLMVALPAAYLLVANFVREGWVLKLMALMMVVLGVAALGQHFVGIDLGILNNGGLMYMWAAGISLSLALFDESLPLPIRAVLLAHAAGWVVWGFFMNISWVAGWFPGFIAMGLLVLIRSRKLVVAAIPVVIGAALLNIDYIKERLDAENNESGITRLAAWAVNWRVTSEHWLFGTGPGGYAAYYMTYFPFAGMATHNNYLDIFAQTGFVGMAVWLWLFGAMLWQGGRLVWRLRGRRDFYEAMANMAFAGTVACVVIMFFGDWMVPFAYTQTIAGFDYAVFNWIFLGTITAIDRMIPEETGAAHV